MRATGSRRRGDEASRAVARRYPRLPPGLVAGMREIPRPFVRGADLDAARGGGVGGVRFEVARPVGAGAAVEITLEIPGATERLRGLVHWVRPTVRRFEVALCLVSPEDAFRARMAAQVARIEAYRTRVRRATGRDVDPERAASDWIRRHAARFARAWAV